MASRDPNYIPPWKQRLGSALHRSRIFARSGAGPAYMRWTRKRSRTARRAAEARGEQHLSRPALYDLDAKLEPYLAEIERGFFVEAGANDGFDQSNTYYLERFRGWRGLLVEPIPHLHREAVLERPGSNVVHAALVAPELEGTSVELRYGGLMSVVAGSKGSAAEEREYVQSAFRLGLEPEMLVSAPGRTLSSLLDQLGSPAIDFMSLDLEGYEPQALRGLDLDRHAPRYLLMEAWDEGDRGSLADVLGERYRFVEQLTPQDALFARVD
ncbi:FkbM family methyltransferase [Conexibacter sp. JD483]|uniref:FkbM family methyltransferase n=1 Tax=unclassified Conexibacter TaxID=2627773 RepID=UPI00272059EB|nr:MULTISPECIES: FkbM family methyltransferase [unclassified Conexibacter]MDO8184053.1 FkbM family methyltransferase [Conexibacter sp. CPCC 205706]MDO8197045.1 FkbM family methyltransferase [Conexibacter sp. CPCC 205762]MDR9367961.1 FkbM family methyltransferase [Conexibacter sp. JD483]